jgi:hypothetical protein
MLTILEGDPGVGKSTVSIAIVAAVTTGAKLPGASPRPPADVVLFTYEDDLAAVVRPRLDAARADLNRVHIVTGIVGEDRLPVFPTDTARLAAVVRETGAQLVVIDPLAAALSAAVDSHKDQDVRGALTPLVKLAEETSAAVLIVRHFTKSANGRAIVAGGGSIGIAAAARSVLAVHLDTDDPARRVLAMVKCNVAPLSVSRIFCVATASNGHPQIEWIGESALSADALIARRAEAESSDDPSGGIDEWLRLFLAGGPILKGDVMRAAKLEGFSERSVYRAAKRLAVLQKRGGFAKELRSWWSISTSSSASSASSAAACVIGENGENGEKALQLQSDTRTPADPKA